MAGNGWRVRITGRTRHCKKALQIHLSLCQGLGDSSCCSFATSLLPGGLSICAKQLCEHLCLAFVLYLETSVLNISLEHLLEEAIVGTLFEEHLYLALPLWHRHIVPLVFSPSQLSRFNIVRKAVTALRDEFVKILCFVNYACKLLQ